MRASGAGEPYWRITNTLQRVNGTGVLGRLQVIKIVFNAAANEFPVHPMRGANGIDGVLSASRRSQSDGLLDIGRLRRTATARGGEYRRHVLRYDDRDVCLNQY